MHHFFLVLISWTHLINTHIHGLWSSKAWIPWFKSILIEKFSEFQHWQSHHTSSYCIPFFLYTFVSHDFCFSKYEQKKIVHHVPWISWKQKNICLFCLSFYLKLFISFLKFEFIVSSQTTYRKSHVMSIHVTQYQKKNYTTKYIFWPR